jgi:hypothetical protein
LQQIQNPLRGFFMLTDHPLLRETLISLAQGARKIPPYRGSRGCNPSTLFRWLTQGVKLPNGQTLKLEGLRLAGRWLTSEQALDRFLSAQHAACAPDQAEQPAPPTRRTPNQRQKHSERAAKRLQELGV